MFCCPTHLDWMCECFALLDWMYNLQLQLPFCLRWPFCWGLRAYNNFAVPRVVKLGQRVECVCTSVASLCQSDEHMSISLYCTVVTFLFFLTSKAWWVTLCKILVFSVLLGLVWKGKRSYRWNLFKHFSAWDYTWA